MVPAIVFPVVHNNGSAPEDLESGYVVAAKAVLVAAEAVRATAPDGRDYYVHADPDAAARAHREHDDRLVRLRTVLAELEALAADLRRQKRARDANRRA